MKLYIITILFSTFFLNTFCQADEKIISSDTLRFTDITFKKVLGFQMESGTIFIDYNIYKKKESTLTKKRKRIMKVIQIRIGLRFGNS